MTKQTTVKRLVLKRLPVEFFEAVNLSVFGSCGIIFKVIRVVNLEIYAEHISKEYLDEIIAEEKPEIEIRF